MQNIIFVRNLQLSGIRGQSKRLLNRVFTVEIDVSISDIESAVKYDALEETFDYRKAVVIAKEIIEGPSVHLIETLASRIVEEILKHHKVQKVKLTLWKREFGDDFDSGITLVREACPASRVSSVR